MSDTNHSLENRLETRTVGISRRTVLTGGSALAGVLGVGGFPSGARGSDLAARREAIESLPEDPPQTLFKSHYIVSNEPHTHHLLPTLDARGGVYIGIATDQNFVLIPRLRPTLVVMMDFDRVVVETHKVLRYAFATRQSPQEFMRFFSAKRVSSHRKEILASKLPEADKVVMRKTLGRFHEELSARFEAERTRANRDGAATYLNDPASYQTMHELAATNRYATVQGDLVGTHMMTALGAYLREQDLKVGTLALSNAEQYFPFNEQYIANITALPFAQDAVVLRTYRHLRGEVKPRGYHYYRQTAANFLECLRTRGAKDVQQLLEHAVATSDRRVHGLEFPIK